MRDHTATTGATLFNPIFLNRQTCICAGPRRGVVVRTFPARADRAQGPNPTKDSQSHRRRFSPRASAAARQLSEVLEISKAVTATCSDLRDARRREKTRWEPHAVLNETQRCLIGAYFLHEYCRGRRPVQSAHRAHPISPARRERLSVHMTCVLSAKGTSRH